MKTECCQTAKTLDTCHSAEMEVCVNIQLWLGVYCIVTLIPQSCFGFMEHPILLLHCSLLVAKEALALSVLPSLYS